MHRYFPLIDCTSDGLEKFPMFPGKDINTTCGTGFTLFEVAPNRYRMIAHEEHEPEDYKKYKIRCPKCGVAMDIKSPHITKNTLALYACKDCE